MKSRCNTLLNVKFLIPGMLEDQDVTSSMEDMFEAIGPFLEQVDGSKTEDEIRLICDRLYALVVKK